ncbi:hypothetical protein DICVIV_03493 [Dictyocaulus viviparus]|uniref:Uncharacterized protein n=1 Tax=Dictyocaulus viviparus TaxID=29172 RepID=A0A0D8Y0Z5_DICVI|nr:hypothetical protein DICVIV_03493 [Dictyocaulus viviparus]
MQQRHDGCSVQSILLKLAKASRGRKMKSPGVLADGGTAPVKRGASQTPSPAPLKASRIESDTMPFRNGIIGIAKSDTSATCSPSFPLGVVTPPNAAHQTPRTPLSADSKPNTTSAESTHPSDPGHRASSATPSGSGNNNPASLFVNTSSASLLTQAGLLSHQLAASQQLGIDPFRFLHNPQLAASLSAAAAAGNPFLSSNNIHIDSGPYTVRRVERYKRREEKKQQQQQQALQLQQAAIVAAAASANQVLNPSTGLGPCGSSLPFPSNAALGPQLAGAALLGRPIVPQQPPSFAPRKPGRWCGMHVKIAHDIAAYRQSQQQKDKQSVAQNAVTHAEQRVRATAAPLSTSSVASTSQTVTVGSDTTPIASAQHIVMQHAALSASRGVTPQVPHCLPSTSSATAPPGYPSLASLPPQALQGLALSGNQQMLSALQEARRVAVATPKQPQQPIAPQRPPSAIQRNSQQPAGLSLPPGFASLGTAGLSLSAPTAAAGSITNGTSDAAAAQQAMLQAVAQYARNQSLSNLPPGLAGAAGHMLLNQAQLLQLQMAQAQQQQAVQAQAAQQQQSGAMDPREALLRLYSQSSSVSSGRGGIEAFLNTAQHQSMGGTPTSQSSLFNPALLGLQGLGAQYAKPFAANLQQLGQMKRDGGDVIPNGR